MSHDIAQSNSEKQQDAELSAAKRALLNKYRKGTAVRRTQTQDVIPAHDPDQAVPLSFGQQQLWLLDQLLPGVPTYTECATVYLPGLLNVSALQQALDELVQRHEAWRTNFVVENDEPVQKVNPPFSVPFSYQDVRSLPESEREQEAVRLAAQNAQEPFDLANGPLLRALLFQLDEQEHRLFIVLHHIIFDGVSLYQIFLPELYTLYTTFEKGETTSPLAPLPLQYADFAAWQRRTFSQQEIERQLSYWKTQLQDAPTQLNLPVDHPRPTRLHNPTNRGAAYNFTFSRDLTEELRALSQREGVSLYTVLVSAFQTLLYRYTGQNDMLTGFVSDGRTQPSLRPLLGYFLNTLVLRAKVSDSLTFRELLRQTRDTMLEAIAHQDVPFEYLVKELHPERIPGQNPLIQTSVSLVPPPPTYESGWTVTQMDVSTRSAKFDVAIELDDRPEGLTGRYEYSTDLFEASTIERMVHHWQHILESVVQDTTQPL
ncbi:MAG TPA: non-ribosomal peptide synthetase, partial [Ktedonobacter sp.]|nr:non-ribosomal peptide synthetase [Ktedonobacter sp.]